MEKEFFKQGQCQFSMTALIIPRGGVLCAPTTMPKALPNHEDVACRTEDPSPRTGCSRKALIFSLE